MAPNIKVSRRSDRSFGKRDVSARATHLKAVFERVSITTIERKIMSTKTTFKRVALVAVSALGLGLLTTVPSQATVTAANVTISATNQAITLDTARGNSTVSDSKIGRAHV